MKTLTKLVSLSIVLAAVPMTSATAQAPVATTEFECQFFETEADFDKEDPPTVLKIEVTGNPYQLDSQWTLVKMDGERANAETFESRHGHEGSLGLKVTFPDGGTGTFYITFAGRHADVPWTLFWATSDLTVPFQPPGFSCDNTKAVKAEASK